jgi:predicted membrane protein
MLLRKMPELRLKLKAIFTLSDCVLFVFLLDADPAAPGRYSCLSLAGVLWQPWWHDQWVRA